LDGFNIIHYRIEQEALKRGPSIAMHCGVNGQLRYCGLAAAKFGNCGWQRSNSEGLSLG